jgi:hypothetical protein
LQELLGRSLGGLYIPRISLHTLQREDYYMRIKHITHLWDGSGSVWTAKGNNLYWHHPSGPARVHRDGLRQYYFFNRLTSESRFKDKAWRRRILLEQLIGQDEDNAKIGGFIPGW